MEHAHEHTHTQIKHGHAHIHGDLKHAHVHEHSACTHKHEHVHEPGAEQQHQHELPDKHPNEHSHIH